VTYRRGLRLISLTLLATSELAIVPASQVARLAGSKRRGAATIPAFESAVPDISDRTNLSCFPIVRQVAKRSAIEEQLAHSAKVKCVGKRAVLCKLKL